MSAENDKSFDPDARVVDMAQWQDAYQLGHTLFEAAKRHPDFKRELLAVLGRPPVSPETRANIEQLRKWLPGAG